ncbi:MAG TPA: hypothetical protein VHE12_04075 [bacterium]|nr:hypothetical protein [bacterium]
MKWFLLFLSSVILVCVGCAGLSKELEFTDTASHALVFGYLDTDKSPCNLNYIEYQQTYPAIEKPFYYMRIDQKAFYREDFTVPGRFKLAEYGGSPHAIFTNVSQYNMKFPEQGYDFTITQPGRLYFLGSYRVVEKGDFFASDSYLERVDRPNQLEVLQMIQPNAANTPWAPIIANAIRILSSRPQ